MKIPLCVTSGKNAALILASACVGFIGFGAIPRAAPLILLVPVFWTLADSRIAAFACVLACKLAASRGLLPGATVFLSENHTPAQAAALYFLLSFGASLPFGVFWVKEKKRKALGLIGAFVTAYVLPPFSLIGILNPLMASGAVFKGWGFAGIFAVLAIYTLCALSKKAVYSFVCVVLLFAALPASEWYEPPKAENIVAIDTSFGKLGSGSFNFTRDYERAGMVFDSLKERDVRESEKILVLPETVAGRLNDTGLELWSREIQRITPGRTVIFGAELPAEDGTKYDNALLMLHDNGKITAVQQRIPVPYSMYAGPFAETGARLHLGDDGILNLPDGHRAAVVICYEAFLTWPVIRSMMSRPDVLIVPANLWWCRETSLPVVMERAVSLWAVTFGVPAVSARNI